MGKRSHPAAEATLTPTASALRDEEISRKSNHQQQTGKKTETKGDVGAESGSGSSEEGENKSEEGGETGGEKKGQTEIGKRDVK